MIAILYAAEKKLTPAHHLVRAWSGSVVYHDIWVRATLHKSGDVETALACAKPLKGETVLNAIDLDGEAQ